MVERLCPAIALALLLSACTTVPTTAPAAIPSNAGPMASAYGKSHALIGVDAKRLTQMFGEPRLDIRDRSVRKLQFANGRCILDAYLYSSAKGKEPVVTYTDSRLPNGKEIGSIACAALLNAK